MAARRRFLGLPNCTEPTTCFLLPVIIEEVQAPVVRVWPENHRWEMCKLVLHPQDEEEVVELPS